VADYIQHWRETAVDSPERFEFFLKSKAEEIRSGSELEDYTRAIAIRYDQLTGLIRVLRMLLNHMVRFTGSPIPEVIEDPIFIGLSRA
jgi:hypothetical protein